MVELDDETFEAVGSFPLKREVYAQALKNISEFQPAVVAFDILFLDPSNQESDEKLEAAFQTYPQVVIGASINPAEKKLRGISSDNTQSVKDLLLWAIGS